MLSLSACERSSGKRVECTINQSKRYEDNSQFTSEFDEEGNKEAELYNSKFALELYMGSMNKLIRDNLHQFKNQNASDESEKLFE